jgi:glycosyltransferase involved in cell wall biosynthesis
VKVGLVTRHLGLPVGFGTYAVNLLRAFDELEHDNEYVIYAPAWNDVPALGPRFRVRRFRVPRLRSALNLWDLTLPASVAAQDRVGLLHYLHPGYPAKRPRRPVVVNLLDAIGWVLPGYRLPQPYERLERRAALRADLVLTLSESARSDIVRAVGVPREKIRVTYLGSPPLDDQPVPKEHYFLFVGGTERRKNLRAVLQAFRAVDGFELRVVGQHEASPVHDARTEQEGVRWLGHVSEQELAELYRRATALVFPSHYEGFGLPVVEAMARHTPVIAADTSSIPEVARGAAILVHPDDAGALRDAMRRVAADAELRTDLTARGRNVARDFTWDRTARATLAAYEELCT